MRAYIEFNLTDMLEIMRLKEFLRTTTTKVVDVSQPINGKALFSFDAKNNFEAKKDLTGTFRWILRQDKYGIAFQSVGLIDNTGEEWKCNECKGTIMDCDCKKLETSIYL